MNCKRIGVISLLFVLTFISSSAVADSPIDKEAALDGQFDQLVRQAQGAFEEGDYEAAAEYLVVANQIRSDPRLFMNIARSYEEAGDCVAMLAYYAAFLEDPIDNDALIDRAQSTIDDNIDDCDGFDETLGGRLSFTSEPALARVYLDDEYMGLTPTETAGLEAGDYSLRIELEDYEDYAADIEVQSGQSLEVSVELDEAIEEDDEPDDIEPPDEVEADGFSPHPVAISLLGVGVGSLVAGGTIDLLRLPSMDQDIEDANARGDHNRVRELRDSRNRWATGAAGLYIASGVFVAIGGGWLIYDLYTAGDTDEQSPYGWRVSPSVHSEGAGLNLRRRF